MTDQAPTLPTARVIEAALRGAGLSRRQSKALMAQGMAAIGIDDEHEHDEQTDDAALADSLRKAAQALRCGLK